MLRILEISWLSFSIIGLIMGSYKFLFEGMESSIWFFLFSLIAFMFYVIRRRQRIAMDRENHRNLNG
ncbi:MAG TPA: hypothetical protein PKH65_00050 [Bacteroidia bacterium]|nr:hypothetical protein [Bacteroidia bacterium]HNT79044.1 hypothetical protein [Bacteroidia bacterium]